MPAIAQISINFTSNAVIRNPGISQFTNQVVSPFTLTQYLLYNRERSDSDFGITNSGNNLRYDGGFISAGDKINYKHSDLQIRQNLDIEDSIYVNNIYANRISSSDYRVKKATADNVRQVNIAPNLNDASTNYIRINTNTNSRVISLFSNYGSVGENSIVLNNTGSAKTVTITTGSLSIASTSTSIQGTLTTDNTITTTGQVTVNNNLRASGNLSIGTSNYNQFMVAGSTGNTQVGGSLTVQNSTNLVGTLTVLSTTTLSNSLNFNSATTSNRRITNIRRLADVSEFNGTTFSNDAIAVADVRLFAVPSGFVGMWFPVAPNTFANCFDANGLGIGNMAGWAVCNGNNGTPNLRDRFVVGAGGTYPAGTTGGANTVTLTVNEMPVHNHNTSSSTTNGTVAVSVVGNTGAGTSHNHVVTSAGSRWGARGAGPAAFYGSMGDVGTATQRSLTSTSEAAHTHPVNISTSASLFARGGGAAHENRPPYYAIIFVMKL